jgi:hypothetical protein
MFARILLIVKGCASGKGTMLDVGAMVIGATDDGWTFKFALLVTGAFNPGAETGGATTGAALVGSGDGTGFTVRGRVGAYVLSGGVCVCADREVMDNSTNERAAGNFIISTLRFR